jgi:hypothetical protein
MTNFAKMWLTFPAKEGFEPDDRQEWVCPDCGQISSFYYGDSRPLHKCPLHSGDLGDFVELQPIPRLDQLVRMVPFKHWDELTPVEQMQTIVDWTFDPWGYGSMPFPKQGEKILKHQKYVRQFKTWEELWLAFIAWERGYQWKEGKWQSIEKNQ